MPFEVNLIYFDRPLVSLVSSQHAAARAAGQV